MSERTSIKHKFAEKQVLIPLSACLFLAVCFVANFIFNLIFNLVKTTFSDVFHPQPFHIKSEYIYHFQIGEYPYVYGVVALLGLIVVLKFVYEMRSNFKYLNHNQKGSARFTTKKELKEQYKGVPERKKPYKGEGGAVISRLGKEVLIDDSPVNNLIIGTTRSGKGESFVFPTIDVYSRAEYQPSLILNDPKGELFAASKDTLEKRGYHVEVLNLINPLESMSYNLLQLIKDAYKEEDYSTAQALCSTLTHTLYYNPNAKDPMWQQSAMSLVNAMILAITEKCIAEGTEEKISMFAVANMLSDLGSQEVLDDNGDPQNALDMYFQALPLGNVAKLQYATSNFSKGNTRSGIFTEAMSKLTIFTFDEIAKMTAKNSIDLKRVGFGRTITGKATPRQRVTVFFPDGTEETVKTDTLGRFELNFTQDIQEGDHVKVSQEDSKTTVAVRSIHEEDGKTEVDVVESDGGITVSSIICFNKPTAIFMMTPDYDPSNHVIASIFVRQLYFVLAKYASLARGGKCHRQVVFMLDEFGNMPSIEGMSNIITVCLGRNIRFNLVVQGYDQLKKQYGDDSKTISGNCGNHIYILTNDNDTAEEVSKALGEKTIDSLSRSGKGLSFDKSKTEGVDSHRLMTPDELKSLKEGESVVLRVIKRQDQKRQRIRAHPIYNTGETALKYRWEYLGEEFDTDKSVLDIDVRSLHEHVKPQDLLIDFFEDSEESDTGQEDEQNEDSVPSDSPFAALSFQNWQVKTVEEFFATDKAILEIIEKFFVDALEKTIDEVKSETMEEFQEQLKILGNNDAINRNVYQAVSGKINKIVHDLKKQDDRQETEEVS